MFVMPGRRTTWQRMRKLLFLLKIWVPLAIWFFTRPSTKGRCGAFTTSFVVQVLFPQGCLWSDGLDGLYCCGAPYQCQKWCAVDLKNILFPIIVESQKLHQLLLPRDLLFIICIHVSAREKKAYTNKDICEEAFIPDFSVPHFSIPSPHHASCKWFVGFSPPSPPHLLHIMFCCISGFY